MRPISLFLLFIFLLIGLGAIAQCPIIEGAMVNSCNSNGLQEGPNEFFIFKTTNAVAVSNYTLYYSTSSTPRNSPNAQLAGASASVKTGPGNIITQNCTVTFITSPATIIPANSRVIFIPADVTQDYDVSAICNGGNLYVVYINRNNGATNWTTNGNFGNSPASPRYLQLVNGAATCASNIVQYQNNWPGDPQNPLISFDGNFVSWNANGNATYSNNGCSIIPPISSVSISITPLVNICKGKLAAAFAYTSLGSPDRYSVTWDAAAGSQGFSNINNTSLPPSPLQLAVPIAVIPGTYTAKVLATNTSSGVASEVQTITLVIDPPLTSVTNATVCPNQLPYQWRGVDYNTAGTYSFTVSSPGICDSLVTLKLQLAGTITTNVDTTVCANQLPLNWNGIIFNSASSVGKLLTSAAGCDSMVTYKLTLKQSSASTNSVSLCAAQLPFSWNGSTYTAAGTYTKTLVNAIGCDSLATLNLSIKKPTSSTTSIQICPAQLPFSWSGSTYTVAGMYTKTLVNAVGCDSVATLQLTIGAAVISNTVVAVCQNNLPFTWSGTNYNLAGTYTKTLVASSGCDSIATLLLSIKQNTTSSTAVSICVAQLPYVWNGTPYNASGTYTKTLVNAAGCDSIATLMLTVKQASTSSTAVSICVAQLPYVWNGTPYTGSGTYSKTLVNAAGCDSIAMLMLTVKQASTSSTAVSICVAQLPYVWNGTLYNASGTYTKTLVNSAGCDSIATLVLTVKQATASSTTVSICVAQLPYVWNGTLYNGSGTYIKTLVNVSGCDSIAMLMLTIKQPSTSTTSIAVCKSQLPFTWNGATYTTGGTYTKTLVNAAGCDSIATLQLTEVTSISTVVNVNACEGQLPYVWNGTSYTAAGTYVKTLKNMGGCDSIVTLTLKVLQATLSTTNLMVCPAQLPYIWNGTSYSAGGTFNKTFKNVAGCDSTATLVVSVIKTSTDTVRINACQAPVVWNGVSYSSAGTFTRKFLNAKGCDSVLVLILTIKPAATSTTNAAVCADKLPYSWNNTLYTATGSFTKTFTTPSGCDSVAVLNLVVNPVPPVTMVSANSPLCTGQNLRLTASSAANATYRWQTPAGQVNNSQNPVFNNVGLAAAGKYTVTATINGCSRTDTVVVQVLQSPAINTPLVLNIVFGDTGYLTPVVLGGRFTSKWSPSQYFVTADTLISPRVLGVTDISYQLTVTDQSLCTATAFFTVKVLPRNRPIAIPNAFSPNNDGINDRWVIPELAFYPQAVVEVYDRYGRKVFTANGGYYAPWDGTISGKPLPVGTYYYIVNASKKAVLLSGWVAIIR